MTYKVSYPGGAYVSSTPITRNSYIRAGQSYTPPAGYASAGPQTPGAASFRSYLQGVSAGRYFAGYSNYVRGHGLVKPR